MVGTIGHWVMGTLSTSAKRSAENKNAEQKQRNKNSGIKIGGDHWTLGNGDPKYKCKKVRTKMRNKTAEQKEWNKKSGTKTAE